MAERAHEQGSYIGKALRRREDVRFVQGRGRYVDDIVLPAVAWCAFVRSPHAHARIRALSTKAAAMRPGVLLTLTAEDWAKAGHGELTEAVEVDYDPLPAVVDPRAAVNPAAPLVHEQFGTNVVFEIERGNRHQTEAAMALASKVVELDLTNNRVSANPIEPRSYLCECS